MPELIKSSGFLFSCFRELLNSGIAKKSNKFLTPRNFNIFIRVSKKAGADVSKNYTDPSIPAAQNNFKNQHKNYQTKYKYFKNTTKAGADMLKK